MLPGLPATMYILSAIAATWGLRIPIGPVLLGGGIAIRVFDLLHSGIGDAVRQANVIGDLQQVQDRCCVYIFAPDGHMRWLMRGSETLPLAWRGWLGTLYDFVATSPILDIGEILDDAKGMGDGAPWLTCRQCRRLGEMPLAQPSFYRPSILPGKWSEAIILENFHTGGYSCAETNLDGEVNKEFSILDKERRGSTIYSHVVSLASDAWGRDFQRQWFVNLPLLGAKCLASTANFATH